MCKCESCTLMAFGFLVTDQKRWLDTKLECGLNNAADVMAKHFAECFINLCCPTLASKIASKLRFDHAERAFDVRPLVIRSQELITIHAVVVIHLFEHSPACTVSVHLESNKRCAAQLCYSIVIIHAGITFICGYLIDLEILSGLFDQRSELRRIASITICHFNRCYDVSFNACHKVAFNPLMLRHFFAILGVKPSDILTR